MQVFKLFVCASFLLKLFAAENKTNRNGQFEKEEQDPDLLVRVSNFGSFGRLPKQTPNIVYVNSVGSFGLLPKETPKFVHVNTFGSFGSFPQHEQAENKLPKIDESFYSISDEFYSLCDDEEPIFEKADKANGMQTLGEAFQDYENVLEQNENFLEQNEHYFTQEQDVYDSTGGTNGKILDDTPDFGSLNFSSTFPGDVDCLDDDEEQNIEWKRKSKILKRFLGKWKRQKPDEEDLVSFQQMINVALNENRLPMESLVEKVKTVAAKCKPTVLIEEDEVEDALKLSVVDVDLNDTGYNRVTQYALKQIVMNDAKGKTEIWDFLHPGKSMIQNVNNFTDRVCGMEITENGIKFGYLQCKSENNGFKTCTQFVEVSKDLGENKFIDTIGIYYLQKGAGESIQKYFGSGKSCPKLEGEMYSEYTRFNFEWWKQNT